MKIISYKFILFFFITLIIPILLFHSVKAETNYGLDLEREEKEVRMEEQLESFQMFKFLEREDYRSNEVNIEKFNWKNLAWIKQKSDNNLSEISQLGNINHGYITQIGNRNIADISQNNNHGYRFGFIYQEGDDNKALINQKGKFNVGIIGQFGNENEANISQDSFSEFKIEIQQNGNENKAGIMALNQSKNLTVEQYGNNQNIEILIGR